MDFKDSIKQISERIIKLKDNYRNRNYMIMKKILLLFFVVLPSAISAQKIISNKYINGERMIICDEVFGSKMIDKHKLLFSIGYISESYVLSLHINSQYAIEIPKGGRILIKLMDDTVITLDSELGGTSEKKVDVIGHKAYTHYQVFSQYTINEKHLCDFSKGVKKVKVENTDSNIIIEKEWKTDKIGSYLYRQYNLISESLKNSSGDKDSFEDGF